MERVSLRIDGMSCGHCIGAVTRTLQGLEGTEVERVEIGSASVRYDPACTDPGQIARALEKEGYPAREQ